MTSMSRQMYRKEFFITEQIESLQTTTNNLKASLDQKACKILNKTEAVFDTESFNTSANTISTPKHQNVDTNKTLSYPKNSGLNKKLKCRYKNQSELPRPISAKSSLDSILELCWTFPIDKTLIPKGRPNFRLQITNL